MRNIVGSLSGSNTWKYRCSIGGRRGLDGYAGLSIGILQVDDGFGFSVFADVGSRFGLAPHRRISEMSFGVVIGSGD